MVCNCGTESVNALNDIYKAADMGAQSFKLLIEKTDDANFKDKLKSYLCRYNEIRDDAAALLSDSGEEPKSVKKTDKASLWMGVQFNTLIDKSPSHMAEMLIQGGTMGIIEVVRLKNVNTGMDCECREIADKFLILQQEHIDDMKQYLR